MKRIHMGFRIVKTYNFSKIKFRIKLEFIKSKTQMKYPNEFIESMISILLLSENDQLSINVASAQKKQLLFRYLP